MTILILAVGKSGKFVPGCGFVSPSKKQARDLAEKLVTGEVAATSGAEPIVEYGLYQFLGSLRNNESTRVLLRRKKKVGGR